MAATKIGWTDALIERFWGYVEKTNACWLWRAGCFTNGYGQFRVGPKKVKAHRFAYEITNGRLLPGTGLLVCHTCDNPKCVNPEHLFLGTAKDNTADCVRKGRNARYNLPRLSGAANGQAKLRPEDVASIQIVRACGKSYRHIARMFNISPSQVANIVKGRAWQCLTIQK